MKAIVLFDVTKMKKGKSITFLDNYEYQENYINQYKEAFSEKKFDNIETFTTKQHRYDSFGELSQDIWVINFFFGGATERGYPDVEDEILSVGAFRGWGEAIFKDLELFSRGEATLQVVTLWGLNYTQDYYGEVDLEVVYEGIVNLYTLKPENLCQESK